MAILCLSPKAKYHIPSPSVDQIIVPENNNTAFYIDNFSWNKLVDSLNNKYTSHLQQLEKYERDFERDGENYLELSKKISRMDLSNKSNVELLDLYQNYQEKLFTYSVFTWTSFILNNFVAERATTIIDKYLKLHNMEEKKLVVIDSLFQPIKQAAVIKLQHEVYKYKDNFSKNKFNELYNNYKWLSCLDLHNDPWTMKQFEEVITTFKKQTAKKVITFNEYVDKLKINKKDLQYLLMAQRFVYIKDARDDFRRKGILYVLPFFAEMAKRMGIKTKDISYVKSLEVINFLRNNIFVSQSTIDSRKKGFVMYLDNKNNIICLDGENISKTLIQFKLFNKNEGLKEIKGMVASQGTAKGKVAIVHGVKDLEKVKKGNILVAATTHPDYTIAMRRASAIITDEGGITSHAAIVSREYGIPCIVGTGNATKILKDGDLVEVYCGEGTVKVINHK
jgi:phosphohistidine swiveling domain-containing protein